jgi:hypothetical protein
MAVLNNVLNVAPLALDFLKNRISGVTRYNRMKNRNVNKEQCLNEKRLCPLSTKYLLFDTIGFVSIPDHSVGIKQLNRDRPIR